MIGTVPKAADQIVFFATPADFRRWLDKNHRQARELWVGFYKKESGRPSITWPESVDEALCFGWIDGVRKSVDPASYKIRFTPRKPDSIWSAVNTRRVAALKKAGRMAAAGLAAFARRDAKRTRQYSYERAAARFTPAEERLFKAARPAWDFFRAQPPSYQRVCAWYLASAKKEETRRRRLETLIEASARGRRIDDISRKDKPG
jgi:uncharacterized protein YdeI (YjbR/CyaY-like superfamily)